MKSRLNVNPPTSPLVSPLLIQETTTPQTENAEKISNGSSPTALADGLGFEGIGLEIQADHVHQVTLPSGYEAIADLFQQAFGIDPEAVPERQQVQDALDGMQLKPGARQRLLTYIRKAIYAHPELELTDQGAKGIRPQNLTNATLAGFMTQDAFYVKRGDDLDVGALLSDINADVNAEQARQTELAELEGQLPELETILNSLTEALETAHGSVKTTSEDLETKTNAHEEAKAQLQTASTEVNQYKTQGLQIKSQLAQVSKKLTALETQFAQYPALNPDNLSLSEWADANKAAPKDNLRQFAGMALKTIQKHRTLSRQQTGVSQKLENAQTRQRGAASTLQGTYQDLQTAQTAATAAQAQVSNLTAQQAEAQTGLQTAQDRHAALVGMAPKPTVEDRFDALPPTEQEALLNNLSDAGYGTIEKFIQVAQGRYADNLVPSALLERTDGEGSYSAAHLKGAYRQLIQADVDTQVADRFGPWIDRLDLIDTLVDQGKTLETATEGLSQRFDQVAAKLTTYLKEGATDEVYKQLEAPIGVESGLRLPRNRASLQDGLNDDFGSRFLATYLEDCTFGAGMRYKTWSDRMDLFSNTAQLAQGLEEHVYRTLESPQLLLNYIEETQTLLDRLEGHIDAGEVLPESYQAERDGNNLYDSVDVKTYDLRDPPRWTDRQTSAPFGHNLADLKESMQERTASIRERGATANALVDAAVSYGHKSRELDAVPTDTKILRKNLDSAESTLNALSQATMPSPPPGLTGLADFLNGPEIQGLLKQKVTLDVSNPRVEVSAGFRNSDAPRVTLVGPSAIESGIRDTIRDADHQLGNAVSTELDAVFGEISEIQDGGFFWTNKQEQLTPHFERAVELIEAYAATGGGQAGVSGVEQYMKKLDRAMETELNSVRDKKKGDVQALRAPLIRARQQQKQELGNLRYNPDSLKSLQRFAQNKPALASALKTVQVEHQLAGELNKAGNPVGFGAKKAAAFVVGQTFLDWSRQIESEIQDHLPSSTIGSPRPWRQMVNDAMGDMSKEVARFGTLENRTQIEGLKTLEAEVAELKAQLTPAQ